MRNFLRSDLPLTFAILLVAPNARAFGGSAGELSNQGNFVVTNDAGFGFGKPFNTPDTHFVLEPALHYMVINHLSLGAAIGLAFTDDGHGASGSSFDLRPYVGYEAELSDTWSIWPRGYIDINPQSGADPQGNAGANATIATVGAQVPFLIHPAQHFFFGIYPELSTRLSDNPPTFTLGGGFLIGGYFDS